MPGDTAQRRRERTYTADAAIDRTAIAVDNLVQLHRQGADPVLIRAALADSLPFPLCAVCARPARAGTRPDRWRATCSVDCDREHRSRLGSKGGRAGRGRPKSEAHRLRIAEALRPGTKTGSRGAMTPG